MDEPVASERERSADQADELQLGAWFQIVRGLLVFASFITAYLAMISLAAGGQAPGCGPGSNCDKVLSSPWAYWLGIPVALPGLGLYGAFLFSTFLLKLDQLEKAKRVLNMLTLCSFAILGAAVWFVGLQAVVIKAFCMYCCTAHVLASLAAIFFLTNANRIGACISVRLNLAGGISVAVALVALIALVQIMAPTNRLEPKIVKLGELTNSANLKLFPIPGSDLQLKVDHLPLMGSHEAPCRIGLLFDYTCPDCRKQHGYIRKAVEKFDGKLSCLMIPMPLDKNCNNLIEETYPVQIDACEYAKICLAVHQVAADKYDSFDRWLFSDIDEKKELNEVRKYAAELAGAEKLEKALYSEALQKQLKQNILVYKLNYKKSNSVIPQTIVHDHVIFGLSESAEKLQSELQRILKLKSVKPAKGK